mgnify:CR=1 FL=1
MRFPVLSVLLRVCLPEQALTKMKATGEERRDVSDVETAESKLRQLEILWWWIRDEYEEVGGEIVEPGDQDVLVEVPNTPETREQVERIAGMLSVYVEILSGDPLPSLSEVADE